MKIKQFKKEIKGVFKQPKKKYYLGKLRFGTPYFWPINFSKSILTIRKLKLTPEKEYQEIIEKSPWLKKSARFSNFPMVTRSKHKTFKIFNNYYWVEIGWPIIIHFTHLGWKDKWDTPRYEWNCAFQIFFFNWQFCIWWVSPNDNDDKYFEQALWYLRYCNGDIDKAKETWPWVNSNTQESTWDDSLLINKI